MIRERFSALRGGLAAARTHGTARRSLREPILTEVSVTPVPVHRSAYGAQAARWRNQMNLHALT
jgi:hypothetical protein